MSILRVWVCACVKGLKMCVGVCVYMCACVRNARFLKLWLERLPDAVLQFGLPKAPAPPPSFFTIASRLIFSSVTRFFFETSAQSSSFECYSRPGSGF